MTQLSEQEITFLAGGTRTAKLGYVASDGRPLVTPVWFLVDRGELVFTTDLNSAKGRALARDPRVVICVDDQQPPYAFVQVQGQAVAVDDAAHLLDTATKIAARYVGASRAQKFGERNNIPGGIIVRVKPTKVISVFSITG